MPLLPGKMLVKCPKTDSEVNVRNVCVKCGYLKFTSWEGLKPLVACSYEKKPNIRNNSTTEKTSNVEKEGIGGLRRW